MKISKKAQKDLLLSLFYEERNTVQGLKMVQKEFPHEELMEACSAKKKVMPDFVGEEALFNDTEVEFTPAEIVVLKKLFDAKKNWMVDLAPIVQEIKEKFNSI